MTKVGMVWAVGGVVTVTSCWAYFRDSLRKIPRILWNIVTSAEAGREYLDKVVEILWNTLGRPARSWRIVQAIGKRVHRRACGIQRREALADYTHFFRNLPQFQVLRDLVLKMDDCASLKMAVLGCSTGAELYSALWMIRTTRPDLEVSVVGIDISETCIQRAIAGIYPLGIREVEGMTETTYERLFTRQGDALRVQDWLRDGVTWRVANACSPTLRDEFGAQDIVLANNFLCHMSDQQAEDCLKNIAKLLAPNGYLFVWGIDLEVRTRVVRDLGLIPVTARLEAIYAADQRAIEAWPLKYWGIEPMDKRRPDWPVRYAAIFKMPGAANLAA